MNIIEAIKGGKFFKRKNYVFYLQVKYDSVLNMDNFFWISSNGTLVVTKIYPDDLLAEDWEIK